MKGFQRIKLATLFSLKLKLGQKKKKPACKLPNCQNCMRYFPDELIQPFMLPESVVPIYMCPLCAIRLIRKIHNLSNFKFRQPANIERYAAAKQYCLEHYPTQTHT